MDDRTMTTTEEATQLFNKAGEIAGWKPGVGNPLVINYLRIFAELVKAEENEAITNAENALENIASTSSSTRIRRVANEALTAIRARRNHG